jgi:cyclohexanecarboxyl-CoA dehydrogenase
MIFFTEAQKEFCSMVRDFALKQLSPGAMERIKLDHVPREIIEKCSDAGLFRLTTPVKYGGNPRDSVSVGIAAEEISKVDFSAMALLINFVFTPSVMEWAVEELRKEWIPAFASGKKLPCFANTEPDCGSDASAIKTRADRDGDFYVINGEKTSVTLGMQADVVILTAKTDPEAGAKGVTLFFVPLDLSGISRSRFVDMGFIPSGRASITLNGVRIPMKCRIGEEGEGFLKVMRGFDFVRAGVAALGAIGMAEASLVEAVEYVKQRRAFGNPISKYEGVSFKLAEDATLIEASRLLCYEALRLRDEGYPHSKEAAMAKWFAPECAVRAIHDALLIFGWRGYSEAMPIEQRLRDAIGMQIGDGTAEIMKLIIAREMLGRDFVPTM